MVDLGLRIVDVLRFFRVELHSEERVVIAFHDSDKGAASVVIAEGSWGEPICEASIGEESVRRNTEGVVVVEVGGILEGKGTVTKATEHLSLCGRDHELDIISSIV